MCFAETGNAYALFHSKTGQAFYSRLDYIRK
uniref:Uncharacterized protein n=1 Tax=Arundo donax TaxID=35708 RepID=A0A0A9GVI7_ARUDO